MPIQESHRAEGRFIFTNHVQERMATRGVRATAVHAALTYGRIVYARGADIYVIGRKEIAHYAREGIDLTAYDGVQVVVASEGVVVTTYRNRCFHGLRDRHTYAPTKRRRHLHAAA